MKIGTTIVVGGGSRLAAALLARCPDMHAISRCAGESETDNRFVRSYHHIKPAMLDGADTVILVAGATKGSASYLAEANKDLASTVARAAKQAGVRRMVHISSFSVFGRCPLIESTSPERPESPYGKSKWDAERALQTIGGDMRVTSLRLPSLYDNQSGKLAQMIAAGTRWRFLPAPRPDVRRSFLSYRLAAEVIIRLVERPGDWSEWMAAADPTAFDYALGRQAIAEAVGRSVHTLPVAAVQPLAAMIAPVLHASLFQDSLLACDANFAANFPSTLYVDMVAIARAATGA